MNKKNKSPLTEIITNTLNLEIKRFSYRRNGVDYIFGGGNVFLKNNALNFVYIETPFNLLKVSTIDYPANAVKIGRYLISDGGLVDELRDDVDIISSDDSGGGGAGTSYDRFLFNMQRKNIISKGFLFYGGLPSNLQGAYVLRDGKINSIFVKTNNLSTVNIYVYKNVNSTSALQPVNVPVLIISMSGEDYKYIPNVDINYYPGDFFKIYYEVVSGKVDLPSLSMDIQYN